MFGAAVVVSNPDIIKEVFASSQELLLGGNQALRPFVGGYSLLVLDGAPHQRQRKLLMPAFHGERMEAYGREMLNLANAAIDSWPIGRSFPLYASLQAVTLRVILRTVFGLAEGERFERFSKLTREVIERASNPLLLFPPAQRDLGPFSPWGKVQRLLRQGDEILRAQVEERCDEKADGRHSDILSMLMQARDEQGERMSFQELRDELVTMLVAGHETSATALAWTLAFLLREPSLLVRLREELGTATEAGELVPERLSKLPLLDATVREGLRVRPVVPVVGRTTTRAMPVGPYEVPAGSMIVPSIYLAHRRTSVFPFPDRFEPDRFLHARPSPNEWLPFGGGNRRCIGAAFASYEMKMVLAAILWRTSLRLKDSYVAHPVRRGVILAPAQGVPVILQQRQAR
jgi:cytochrome P450